MDEKKNNRNLIIFIDSLPYACVDRMPFLSRRKPDVSPLTPGFGYSINVKAEIFGGYTPDKLGYLNEWSYAPQGALRRYRPFFLVLAPLKNLYYPDRIAHKLVSRICGRNLHNIPFAYLAFFQTQGTEPYREEFHLPTLFSRMKSLKKICYYHFPPGEWRDCRIFAGAMKAISDGDADNVFAAFGDLDGLTHGFGVGSEEHDRKIEELDGYLAQMHDEFKNRNPGGNVFIISDHGMANVNRAVTVNMEKEFGRAGEDGYLYFVDSTMLRVWTFTEKKKAEIENYLRQREYGEVLSAADRERYGITLEKFGSVIFLLNEGVVFNPGFFGRKMPKAMHGYRPELASQQGLLFSVPAKNSGKLPARSVFFVLERALATAVEEKEKA